MTFKEIVQSDIEKTFMNKDEFADDTHMVNGKQMTVIFDDYENIEREKKYKTMTEGLYKKQILVYIKASEFGPMPSTGAVVQLDKSIYRVVDAANEDGLYSITLEASRS